VPGVPRSKAPLSKLLFFKALFPEMIFGMTVSQGGNGDKALMVRGIQKQIE
jgi:hypothetical protein